MFAVSPAAALRCRGFLCLALNCRMQHFFVCIEVPVFGAYPHRPDMQKIFVPKSNFTVDILAMLRYHIPKAQNYRIPEHAVCRPALCRCNAIQAIKSGGGILRNKCLAIFSVFVLYRKIWQQCQTAGAAVMLGLGLPALAAGAGNINVPSIPLVKRAAALHKFLPL